MRFRGTTEEGEVVEFKIYCEDSDKVIEYGSELGVDIDGWKYIKKNTLVCLEVEDLERQLAEAREDVKTYKYDLETLASIVTECVYDMSEEERYDTLKEVADHYKQLKEKGGE